MAKPTSFHSKKSPNRAIRKFLKAEESRLFSQQITGKNKTNGALHAFRAFDDRNMQLLRSDWFILF